MKPVYRIAISSLPGGTDVNEVLAQLEAAGYLALPTSAAEDSVVMSPVNPKLQAAATILAALALQPGQSQDGVTLARRAAETVDQLLKELTK